MQSRRVESPELMAVGAAWQKPLPLNSVLQKCKAGNEDMGAAWNVDLEGQRTRRCGEGSTGPELTRLVTCVPALALGG